MEKVKAYQTKKTIKTYLVGKADINPFISEFLGSLLFYPYPLKNNLTKEVKNIDYNLYCLENDYFHLAVLPDLGGKLYSAFDKRSNRDIFYCNPVVKPQLIGCTGAWTSGGIEFNFPNRGHRPSATDYTDTVFQEYEDGSAAIIISDTDMISWQRFTVELRLYPGKAYIEETVRIYNPNDYNDSYYVWSTSAEHEVQGLEYRYPNLWHFDEEARTKHLWPFGKYGTDLRFLDTMKAYTLPFGSEVLKDYMGLYDWNADAGIVHVADYRLVPGKKAWSWGSATAGRNWCKRLAEDGSGYVEMQTGAVETQNQFNFIDPHTHLEYKEYWLHASNNGPLCAASKDVIASYEIKGDAIHFKLLGTADFPDADFRLIVGDNQLFQRTVSLNPINSAQITVPFKLEWMDEDIKFSLLCGGEILLQETILDNDEALEMIDREEYISSDEKRESNIAKAIDLEKRRHYNKAIELYNQIIDNNPEYIQAYLRRAVCFMKKRDYAKALGTLEKIITGNYEDVELVFYYALALWHNGQQLKAVKHLFKVPNSSPLFAAASYFTALYHTLNREYQSALEKLAYSIKYAPSHFKSFLLYAYILSRIGKKEAAVEVLEGYLRDNPIDYIGMYLLDQIRNTTGYSALIFQQKQNVYELLDFFDQLRDWKECLSIIESYEKQENAAPLLKAYKYYYLDRQSPDQCTRLAAAVESLPLDYNFPNHRIDLQALESILDRSDKAKYLYGLMQYRNENFDLALKYWNELAEKDFDYSVLYRNLAYYYQKFAKDYPRVCQLAEKGLPKKPFNDEFYYLLYTAYKELNLQDKLQGLLESLEKFPEKTEPCIRVWIDMLNYTGQHEKAVSIIKDTEFSFWEIDPDGLMPYVKIYKESYLGLARQALGRKDYPAALDAIENCLNMVKKHEEKFAEVYFYAGLIHEKMGCFQKALEYYDKISRENIVSTDPEFKYLVKAANRMVKLNWIGI
ncbi:MAG: DUF5107 domain-containing protein, partial [Bacillota bacterium]